MGAWNDLRIRCTASQLIVHVNGWELCDVALENALPTDGILTLTSALNGAGPIEWRNIRSRGLTGPATPGHLERVAAVVTNLHDHRAAPAVSIETIVARWNELEQTAAGQTIAWRTLREGDRRWSPFQAAVHPQPDDSDWSCTQVSTDRATDTTLWASPFVECDRNGLHDGLHMHNFNLFRTALRNDDTPRFATGRYQLTLDASRKTEFVSAGDTRDAHLTVISPLMNENGSLPLRAEELFNRLLLSALLPLKVYGNAVTPQNCRIEPHLGSFHGTDCVVLTETPSGAGWTRRLFIDPQHDFRICGSWTRHDDGTWDQISYHYDHGPDSQPTPYSWTLVSTRKGEETFHAYAGQERLLVHGTANVISPPDRVQTGMHHAPQTGILYDTQHGLWARQLPNDQQQPLAADDATRRLMPASLRKSSGPELSQWRLATFSGLALVSALVLLARTRRNACRRSVSPFPDH